MASKLGPKGIQYASANSEAMVAVTEIVSIISNQLEKGKEL